MWADIALQDHTGVTNPPTCNVSVRRIHSKNTMVSFHRSDQLSSDLQEFDSFMGVGRGVDIDIPNHKIQLPNKKDDSDSGSEMRQEECCVKCETSFKGMESSEQENDQKNDENRNENFEESSKVLTKLSDEKEYIMKTKVRTMNLKENEYVEVSVSEPGTEENSEITNFRALNQGGKEFVELNFVEPLDCFSNEISEIIKNEVPVEKADEATEEMAEENTQEIQIKIPQPAVKQTSPICYATNNCQMSGQYLGAGENLVNSQNQQYRKVGIMQALMRIFKKRNISTGSSSKIEAETGSRISEDLSNESNSKKGLLQTVRSYVSPLQFHGLPVPDGNIKTEDMNFPPTAEIFDQNSTETYLQLRAAITEALIQLEKLQHMLEEYNTDVAYCRKLPVSEILGNFKTRMAGMKVTIKELSKNETYSKANLTITLKQMASHLIEMQEIVLKMHSEEYSCSSNVLVGFQASLDYMRMQVNRAQEVASKLD